MGKFEEAYLDKDIPIPTNDDRILDEYGESLEDNIDKMLTQEARDFKEVRALEREEKMKSLPPLRAVVYWAMSVWPSSL